MTARDEPSKLLQTFVNYGRKKFNKKPLNKFTHTLSINLAVSKYYKMIANKMKWPSLPQIYTTIY